MKRILLQLLFTSFTGLCLAQTPAPETEIDILKQIKDELKIIKEESKKQSTALGDLQKKIENKKEEPKETTVGYLSLKKDLYIKVYNCSDKSQVENEKIKNFNKKDKLTDYERYKHILAESVDVFIKDTKVESVTVFYDDNIVNTNVGIELTEFKNDNYFKINDTECIKLNELINYTLVLKVNVKETMVTLNPGEKISLTKK